MGWGSGSDLMSEVIKTISKEIKDPLVRKKIYVGLIDAFENHDWDTQDECLGVDPAFDDAMAVLHPEDA